MPLGFWEQLKKPIIGLAPMYDVTDSPFRQMFAKYGKPDVFYTEFASADGLMSEGRDKLMRLLEFTPSERPIVAQIFSANPEKCFGAAKLCAELGFDGIDINMGCPDKQICKQGSGSGLIQDPKLAQEIIRATQEGAPKLPVSVKTRLGYNTNIIEQWVEQLLEAGPAVIAIHGRTKKEMSKVPARWDDIARGAAVVKASGKNTLVFGNGDVPNLATAHDYAKKYNVDGVLVGRGAFGNPWFFNPEITRDQISLAEKLRVLLEHTKLFAQTFPDPRRFVYMKKHFASYIAGHENIKELKMQLMEATNAAEVEQIINTHIDTKE